MMKKTKKPEAPPFVKYYTGLSYMFTPAETRFILHMADIEYKKSCGYNTNWSRAEYMKVMGLNEYTFDNCIKKMAQLNLLSKRNNAKGNKVYYSFDLIRYQKLVNILSSTCNIDKLIAFCKTYFEDGSRSIESITDDEIAGLASYDDMICGHPSMFTRY